MYTYKAYYGPIFCLLRKIFDLTVLAKPFVFYKTL